MSPSLRVSLIVTIGFTSNLPLPTSAQVVSAADSRESAGKPMLDTDRMPEWVGFDAATGESIDMIGSQQLAVVPTIDRQTPTDSPKLGVEDSRSLALDELLGPQPFTPDYNSKGVDGGNGADAIIGSTDDRSRVWDTTAYPFRAVVQLVAEFSDGTQSTCSGTLVRPRTVLSAAHCVYGFDRHGRAIEGRGWAVRIAVLPGLNGNSAPFGGQWATRFYAGYGWVKAHRSQADWSDDFAMIELPDRALYQKVGLTYGATAFDPRLGDQIATTGYPGDKPFGTMWHATGRVLHFTDNLIKHEADIIAGESGGPCWYFVNTGFGWQPTVIGVNSHESIFDRNGNGRFDFGIDHAYYNACAALSPGIVDFLQVLP